MNLNKASIKKVILLVAFLSLAFQKAKAEELPESGPDIRIESDENIDELSRACELENLQNAELDNSSIANPIKGQPKSQDKIQAKYQAKPQMKTQTKIQSKTMAKIQTNAQTRDLKTPSSSCLKYSQAEKNLEHLVQQSRCESLEDYTPTEKAIKNCQSKLRQAPLTAQGFEEDIQHRDVCIVQLQNEYCRQKTDLSAIQ